MTNEQTVVLPQFPSGADIQTAIRDGLKDGLQQGKLARQPTGRKGWFARNWKWFVPVAIVAGAAIGYGIHEGFAGETSPPGQVRFPPPPVLPPESGPR
jgi:hypothetical protein